MWLSSIELSKRLGMTRPSVYRLAKKRGWETKLVAIHGGGNCKLYYVSESEFTPSKTERSSKKDMPPMVSSGDLPDLRPKIDIPLDLQTQAELRARLCELILEALDPATGKPRRMTMIMFFDWASRYPVGASLAVSEDSQHVLLALRNSIMHWGGKPKYVYLDNGKAFRSKLFNKQWERRDLSKELAGIFPRLGIGVVFAKAYNARVRRWSSGSSELKLRYCTIASARFLRSKIPRATTLISAT